MDKNTRLEPILTYFKKGQSHMGIVTEVIAQDDKDPELRMTGIITLEDIIEDLADNDDESEEEEEIERTHGIKNLTKAGQLKIKEQLILLFSNTQGTKELTPAEI
jgi:CBS domain containing-hemolysin-like protein